MSNSAHIKCLFVLVCTTSLVTLVFLTLSVNRLGLGEQATLQQLESRLSELNNEIEKAKIELDKTIAECERETAMMEQERVGLSTKIFDDEIRRIKLTKEFEQLESDRIKSDEEVNRLDGVWKRIIGGMKDAASILSLRVNETPLGQLPSASMLLDGAAQRNGKDKPNPIEVDNYMSNLKLALEYASQVKVERVKIRVASGEVEEVELAMLGFISFAYRTTKDLRIGIALAAPETASGYRWCEALPQRIRIEVNALIDALIKNNAESVLFPMDITGRIRAGSYADKSSFREQFNAGGPLMYPLALLAFASLFIVAERIWFLFYRNSYNSRSAQATLNCCSEEKFEDAEKLLAERTDTVSRMISVCIKNRDAAPSVLGDRIQEQLLFELPRLRRFLPGLGVIASVSPLIGLLGTVTGIIQTFGVIGVFGSSNSTLMAAGISVALITTAAGLMIAIPVFLIRGILIGRVDRIVAESEKYSAALYNMFTRRRNE